MIWIDILLGVVIAMVLGSILTWGLGWRHPARDEAVGVSLTFVLVILIAAMFAGGAWWRAGPPQPGSLWVGFLFIGLFVSLLLLAVAVPPRRDSGRNPVPQARQGAVPESNAIAGTVFGLFFWLLLLGLVAAAIFA